MSPRPCLFHPNQECHAVCQRFGGCTPGKPVELKVPDQTVIHAREDSHGDYTQQAQLAQDLKRVMKQRTMGWDKLSPEQRESLEMIAVKISRILNGNPNVADHWRDISGYSDLIGNLLEHGNCLGKPAGA
jgi:hypothetical protein